MEEKSKCNDVCDNISTDKKVSTKVKIPVEQHEEKNDKRNFNVIKGKETKSAPQRPTDRKPKKMMSKENKQQKSSNLMKATNRKCYVKKTDNNVLQLPQSEDGQLEVHSDNSSMKKGISDENANVGPVLGSSSEASSNDNTSELNALKKNFNSSKETRVQEFPPDKIKKIKQGRIVPSRYMQAIKQSSKPSTPEINPKSLDKGIGTKSKEILNKTSMPVDNLHTTADAKKEASSLQDKKTSTPTRSSNLLPLLNDMSSIVAEASVIKNFARSAMKPKLTGITKIKMSDHLPTITDQKNANDVVIPSLSLPKASPYNPMELLYCRYLQSIFLEVKTKTSLDKKCQNAMEQLHMLWQMNQDLIEQEANLDSQISGFEHLLQVKNHLDNQDECLKPVIDCLSQLDTEYSDLTEAVNTTGHQLPVKDIHLPEVNDLASTLEETEMLTELVINTLKPNQDAMQQLASLLSDIEHTVQIETKELNRCFELMKSTNRLTIEESSLQIQAIQENDKSI